MIETLRITDLAIVERAEIEFGPGLNVLTGETGAGKSLVLGALGLLAGERASAETVRAGAKEARVEAVFRTDRLPEFEAQLRDRGLESESHELVVVRSVGHQGRSRAQVAGRLVPVGMLAELFAGRLEISSQHESQALRRTETHGRLLDAFGGLTPQRAELETLHHAFRVAQAELEQLVAAAEERARREDFLAFQLGEIDEAKLAPGELGAIEAEHRRLAHAEELCSGVAGAAAELAGDPAVSDAPAAADLAAQAQRRISELARFDPRLEALGERLQAAIAELLDTAADLERYAGGVDADPARLAETESRLQVLDRLRRKYGRSEADILAFRERVARELAEIQGSDERRGELEEQLIALRGELAARAQTLSRGRRRAAQRLQRELEGALAELGMPSARIEVALEPMVPSEGVPCGPSGLEQPELRLGANPGEPTQPLRRTASGGELSRLFLALKNILRRAESGMVLVFDEVDAGIGGRAADRVGRLLAELASCHQVVCITHLPQIAALADTHLRVTKSEDRSRTVVQVVPLGEDARIEEIASMAGGERVTAGTRRHARELLGARATLRPGGSRRPRSTS